MQVLKDIFPSEVFQQKTDTYPLVFESKSFNLYWMLDTVEIQTQSPYPLIEGHYRWKNNPNTEEFRKNILHYYEYLHNNANLLFSLSESLKHAS